MAIYEEFRRSPEEYDGTTLRDYAEEIIRTECDTHAAYYGTDRATWYTDDAEIAILKRPEEQPHGVVYSYQFNIHDKVLDRRVIYTIRSSGDSVKLYNEAGTAQADPSESHLIQLMQYLRTYDKTPEPQLNKEGRERFEQLAANIAVSAAIDAGLVDIATLATRTPSSDAYYRYLHDSILTTAQHTICEDGVEIPYTRNVPAITRELQTRAAHYSLQSHAHPQLPPAPHKNDTNDR